MNHFGIFQFTQISLFVMLVALAGLVRERKVLPFLLVIFGSMMNGAIAAALIAASVLWVRFDEDAPKGLRLKDAMAVLFLIVGAAVPSPYREFMICIGTLALSIHFAIGSLGIIPALLLVHLYWGDHLPLEFVLGASGAYIVIAEILKLSKARYTRRVLQFIEIPAIVGILYPLKDDFVTWASDELLLWIGTGLFAAIGGVMLWVQVKNPDFSVIYQKMNAWTLRRLGGTGSVSANRVGWIDPSPSEPPLGFSVYLDRLFWGLVAILVAWSALILLAQGGGW